MKGQIKRVLAILFAVLFVMTLTASAVSASSVAALKISSVNAYDDYCGNGLHPLVYKIPHFPFPPKPEPDPWLIDQSDILSKAKISIESIGERTSIN